jgi:hypothetical protein
MQLIYVNKMFKKQKKEKKTHQWTAGGIAGKEIFRYCTRRDTCGLPRASC